MNQTKLTVLIQFLNSFTSGVLTIALPLLMKERNIDIVTIGLIFACLPMIFQLTRMLFAVVSDFLGRKLFFVLNGFLNILSSSVYYLAYTPLQFLVGKVTEGTKSASLWAVNRAFLLEESGRKRKTLFHLRTSAYVSMAIGSLLAGILIVWLSYTNTLLLCVLVGAAVVPMSLLLTERKKRRGFSKKIALHYLDLRKKEKMFTMFLILFFVMGLSFGFRGGYVFPLFLEENEFDVEAIGVFLGVQTLLAGLSLYLFSKKIELEKLILLSGLLYSLFLLPLGFTSRLSAAFLVIVFGFADGLVGGGSEGILAKITGEKSYGTDIGLLMMGLHAGTTISLATSGFLIARWGFTAPFLSSAFIFPIFYISAYFLLKQQKPPASQF
ncbi:MAG: MFS transporter [Candidatus Bathyarchaeia archaeon]